MHHLADQFTEGDLGLPAELLAGLAGVAEKGRDFRGPVIARIDRNDALASLGVVAFFLLGLALASRWKY